eukprot:jgi/Chrzof1/1236/Cz01g45230.t1
MGMLTMISSGNSHGVGRTLPPYCVSQFRYLDSNNYQLTAAPRPGVDPPEWLRHMSLVSSMNDSTQAPMNTPDSVPQPQLDAATAAYNSQLYTTALRVLEEHYTFEQLGREFQSIMEQSDSADNSCTASLKPGCRSKNRYVDVVPYDCNRVVLTGRHCDYINASYIRDQVDGSQGHAYIATQGPLSNTVEEFWHMVQVTNTSAIVMLTNLADHGKVKCAPYYPEGEKQSLTLPGVQVTCVHASKIGDVISFRQLEVIFPGTGEQRWVNHYHYMAWPDFGVPQRTQDIRRLCRALDDCRRTGCHITVHCSAGVGRTGSFCAVDVLLQRLDWLKLQHTCDPNVIRQAMDVSQLVLSLRKQRPGMVQTGDQYTFIYSAVMDELRALIEECS